MRFTCSTCRTPRPKTANGLFRSVDTGEWDSSFWLFCSAKCEEQKTGRVEIKVVNENHGLSYALVPKASKPGHLTVVPF